MAGQRFLVPYVRVRLLPPLPLRFRSAYVAPSSSGLGRRPLKAEVEGSNPFGATKEQQARAFALAFFFSLRRLLAYRTKRGFSLPAVFCFMSQVSKLAVRELDSSRSLRGAKPVRVSLACGVIGENGYPNPANFAAVVLVWNSALLRKVVEERTLLVGNLLIDDGIERSRKGLADFRPVGNSQCHDVAPIDSEAL